MVSPTIGIEMGVTYTFNQADISNWYHPMGFAYFPDGDHDGKDELEPGISQTGSSCTEDLTCPFPRYFRGSDYLGAGVNGTEDFGLGKSMLCAANLLIHSLGSRYLKQSALYWSTVLWLPNLTMGSSHSPCKNSTCNTDRSQTFMNPNSSTQLWIGQGERPIQSR